MYYFAMCVFMAHIASLVDHDVVLPEEASYPLVRSLSLGFKFIQAGNPRTQFVSPIKLLLVII